MMMNHWKRIHVVNNPRTFVFCLIYFSPFEFKLTANVGVADAPIMSLAAGMNEGSIGSQRIRHRANGGQLLILDVYLSNRLRRRIFIVRQNDGYRFTVVLGFSRG
jgi:hypothetical protein